ncbi:MAG: superoxide dismutase family protein [Oscillospiraceae bacterium]|nr:superoxide dismutase family protein [Oscillospiraceae bacterium]
MSENTLRAFAYRLCRRPDAFACIKGSSEHPSVTGSVRFYQTSQGVLIAAELHGLPDAATPARSGVFGFHIHAGASCTGTPSDPFADAKTHYDPHNFDHPYHSGDLPPLFSNCGNALSIFLTNRFSLAEVMGRTVVIHSKPDDFTTQPSGNSGEKLACGRITALCGN